MLFNTLHKKTYLTIPIRVHLSIRFGSRGPGRLPTGAGNTSKLSPPSAPSSLSKIPTPKKTEPVQSQEQASFPSTDKQPSPPKPAGPLFKEHTSILDKPNVQRSLQNASTNSSTLPERAKIDQAMQDGSWFNLKQSNSSNESDKSKEFPHIQQTGSTSHKGSEIGASPSNTTTSTTTSTNSDLSIVAFPSKTAIDIALDEAFKKGLIKYSDAPVNDPQYAAHNSLGSAKLTKEGLAFYKEANPVIKEINTVPIDISQKTLVVGMLGVHDNTEVLLPEQVHMVVALKSVESTIVIVCDGDQQIGVGYLTSEPGNKSVLIANQQVSGSVQPQYLHPFKIPCNIPSTQFKLLPNATKYIQNDPIKKNVLEATKDIFKYKPSSYNPMSLSLDQLNNILTLQKNQEGSQMKLVEKKSDNFLTTEKNEKLEKRAQKREEHKKKQQEDAAEYRKQKYKPSSNNDN
jgi:hypothetical protein